MATADSVKVKIQGLIDQSNATTGNTDADLTTAVGALIAGFGQGGGDVAELVFETTFSVAESLTTASKTTVATISTGLSADTFNGHGNDHYFLVLQCTEDTDEDFSYSHFKGRTQLIVGSDTASGYMSVGTINCGYAWFDDTSGTLKGIYGAAFGLFASEAGRYLATIFLQSTANPTNWGVVCSGNYSLKLYRLNIAAFGVEGIGDD